jgi:outer membrane lipoprotein-sorting protein
MKNRGFMNVGDETRFRICYKKGLVMVKSAPRLSVYSFETVFFLPFILMMTLATAPVSAQDATEIIERMEDVMRGESSYAEMTMTIERPRYTREVSMRSWALGTRYSLILITSPARDKGTAFLKRDNEMWNYVPSIDRTIKMPPSMLSQSWMGSDFTNDDLVRESSTVDDYEHKILREEKLDGREAWVLELIPKPETPVVWGKVLIWISKERYIQLRLENYDQRDNLASTIAMSDIRELGGRTIPTKMTLTPADKPDQNTVLTWQDMEFAIDLSESFFTQQNMRRIR